MFFNWLLSVFFNCVIWWILSKQSAAGTAAALSRLNGSGVRGAELEETQKQIKTGSACGPCTQAAVVHSYLTSSHKQTPGSVCIITSKHMNISMELRLSATNADCHTKSEVISQTVRRGKSK